MGPGFHHSGYLQYGRNVKNAALPQKAKCTMCKKTKTMPAFSTKEQGKMKNGNFDVRCIICCGGALLELDCVRCGELKDINAFTKVQRVAEDPECRACTTERLETDVNAGHKTQKVDEAPDKDSEEEDDDDDDDDDYDSDGDGAISEATAGLSSVRLGTETSGGVSLPTTMSSRARTVAAPTPAPASGSHQTTNDYSDEEEEEEIISSDDEDTDED